MSRPIVTLAELTREVGRLRAVVERHHVAIAAALEKTVRRMVRQAERDQALDDGVTDLPARDRAGLRALDTTLQSQILDAVFAMAKRHALQVVETMRPFHNIGVLQFHRPKSFTAVASLRFDFQDAAAYLDLQPGAVAKWEFGGGLRIEHGPTLQADLDRFFATLDRMLRRQETRTTTHPRRDRRP